jgi:ribose-phosphate pyrophosphokinase
MIDTAKQLQLQGLKPPVCIGVHGIFADDSYMELKNAGVDKIVTCNSIPHSSNKIDVSPLIIEALK